VQVSQLTHGEAVTIVANDRLKEAERTMAAQEVRRLPVIDGDWIVGS
jgi:CBS domain-containing protein